MAKARKTHEKHRTLKIAISPILLLFPIMGIAALFGRGLDLTVFSPMAIVGASFLFILMSAGFLATSQMEEPKAMVGVSAVTCGLTIVFFTYLMEVGPLFGYIGFFVLISGLIVLLSMVSQPLESLFVRQVDYIVPNSVKVSELQKILDSIRFPCAFLEKNERNEEIVLACNDHFVRMIAEEKPGKGAGSRLNDLLPYTSEGKVLKLYDTDWEIQRSTKGKQTLLTLTPVPRIAPSGKVEVFDSIDPETGLYFNGFMKYKARSDIELINRGKRKLSVVLFHLLPGNTSPVEMPEERKKICRVAFGRIVMDSIRACDSAYLVDQDEVLLLLPDTYGDGTKKVITRVYEAMKRMGALECPPLATSGLIYAHQDFTGKDDLPKYDEILYAMVPLLYHESREIK